MTALDDGEFTSPADDNERDAGEFPAKSTPSGVWPMVGLWRELGPVAG